MFTKPIAGGYAVITLLLGSSALFCQTSAAPSSSSAGLIFPVTMRQKVTAGVTITGTKVAAKLEVATLVNGVVVPQDAILSGEVIESVAKSASGPSRLAIRMDSAQWKSGTAPKRLEFTKKVYLTAWYYPLVPAPQDPADDPPDARPASGIRRGRARGAAPSSTPTYPTSNAPASQPFPGPGSNRNDDTLSAPPPPAAAVSQHRALMKDVEFTRNRQGAVVLLSNRSNIKLDKTTTYILAAEDMAGGPG